MGPKRPKPLTNQVTTLRTILMGAGVVLLGVALMAASIALASNIPVSSFLGQLGGLLLATGLLAVGWELVGRRAFAQEVLDKAKLSADVVDSGLTRVTDQYLEEVEWIELFHGVHTLDIVVAYAATWRRTHWSRIMKVAATPNARIRIFLPDPEDTDTVRNLANRFNKSEDEVTTLIREAIDEYASLPHASTAAVEVNLRRGDALFSCYRFDQRAVLTLYSHSRERRVSVPTFVVSGGDLFEFVLTEIESIAKQSQRVERGGNP